MSKGIVKITPKPATTGSLQITEADPNEFGVTVGTIMSFQDPRFPLRDGDNVECTISSSKTCDVNRLLELA